MLKLEHFKALAAELPNYYNVKSELCWFLEKRSYYMRSTLKRLYPDFYAVIVARKIMLPTFISHPEEGVRIIASFRMRHNI